MGRTMNFRDYFSDQIESVRESFGFTNQNKNGACSLEAPLVREITGRHKALQALYAELDQFGLGMIVQNESGDSFALILPDASEPGRFRYSAFRAIGWMTHYTCDTIDEVIREAFQAGFRLVAPRDTLEKMSVTAEWLKGCERLQFITAHNCGELSWNQMLVEFEIIEAKYAAKAA